MAKDKLSQKKWIAAAMAALRKGGPSAVKIEAIARNLNVSKGSFYWHFEDAGHLKTEMLNRWRSKATASVIAQVETTVDGPDQVLDGLVKVSAMNLGRSAGRAASNEAALRDWARFDPEVAEAMRFVDTQRLAYTAHGFEQCGFESEKAAERAKWLYASLIGLEYLARNDLAQIGQSLPKLLSTLTKQNQD